MVEWFRHWHAGTPDLSYSHDSTFHRLVSPTRRFIDDDSPTQLLNDLTTQRLNYSTTKPLNHSTIHGFTDSTGCAIQRLITAALLLPLVILFTLKATAFQFSLLVFLLSLAGLDEFYRMALPGRRGEGRFAALLGAAAIFTIFAANPLLPLMTLTLLVLGFSLVALFRLQEIPRAAADAALVLMGFLYVPLLLSHLVLIRMLPHGVSWLFLIMVIVMSGDSAAYYVGSSLGKTKLYPLVSPKKSVEGSLGGLCGSVIGAFIARAVFFPELSPVDCVATALVLGVLGQLGDLFESLIKRSCGVKDSGALFPGHGGVLDRLDSILFAAPAAYYYAYFLLP